MSKASNTMSLAEYRDELKTQPAARNEQVEHTQQVSLFTILRDPVVEMRHPEVKRIFSTLNGLYASKASAGKARASGNRKGVPDILCLVPRDTWHGLVIEMKSPGGRLSPEQRDMMNDLKRDNYCYAVCRSAKEALECIESYLGYRLTD